MRAAVLGYGVQGALHVDCLRSIDGVEVVAACDTDPARREAVRTLGIDAHEDFRQLLGAHRLDIVTVATMPVLHREMTVAALEHGAHVLCEKPMATSAADGAAMVAAAERTGRTLSVGFNMRFMRSPTILRRAVEDGTFGAPVYTRAWGKSSHIPWWGQHYRRELSGGGALAATAVHLLDLALWLADFPMPTTASASMTRLYPLKRGGTAPDARAAERYDTEDLISAHLRFASGFWMTLEGSWVEDAPSTVESPSWDYSVDAVGTRAQAQVDPLKLLAERDGTVVSLLDESTVGSMSFPESVRALLGDFVESVREGRAPRVLASEALITQAIVDAVYESARLGREVDVRVPGSTPAS